MKKSILASAIALIITGSAFAQPVADKAVIPIGITLNQILRLHVVNGGNIEFVFNDLTDYTTGIANSAFYDSRFVVASSTDWQLHLGGEAALLEATDNPANVGIALNNVQFTLEENGTYTAGAVVAGFNSTTFGGVYVNSITPVANGLAQYTGTFGTDGLLTVGALFNGGDILQNAFIIHWQCNVIPVVGIGTTVCQPSTMLAQSPSPDRYTTNAFLDLEAL